MNKPSSYRVPKVLREMDDGTLAYIAFHGGVEAQTLLRLRQKNRAKWSRWLRKAILKAGG